MEPKFDVTLTASLEHTLLAVVLWDLTRVKVTGIK